jgi:hypothetical protein
MIAAIYAVMEAITSWGIYRDGTRTATAFERGFREAHDDPATAEEADRLGKPSTYRDPGHDDTAGRILLGRISRGDFTISGPVSATRDRCSYSTGQEMHEA